VNAFQDGEDFLVALTYGRDVDWVKNVLDAGTCRLIHRGRAVDLAGPRILPLRPDAGAIPAWIRGILQILGVGETLRLERGPGPSGL
jgi:hypothetical protein